MQGHIESINRINKTHTEAFLDGIGNAIYLDKIYFLCLDENFKVQINFK